VTDPRTQATQTQIDTRGLRAASGGWAVFVGILLFIIGIFNIIWGLTALLDDDALTVGAVGVIVWDFTAWGWIHLILGIVLVCTSLGLFAGRGWARWTAIFFVMLNAFAQIAWMPVHPWWSVLIITLDLIIIYQLTMNYYDEAAY
jgi:hypothetical protein